MNADSYEITNFGGTTYRGFEGREGEIELDLEGEVPCQLLNAYDIVFNHTTLEHIFDVRKAFTNLCKISNDIVIIVVPFCQVHHETSGYKDFWRFSPTSLRELFKREGLSVVMESYNSIFNASVYIFMVASRMPDRWRSSLPARAFTAPCGEWIGKPLTLSQVTQILIIYARQKLRSLRSWLLSL